MTRWSFRAFFIWKEKASCWGHPLIIAFTMDQRCDFELRSLKPKTKKAKLLGSREPSNPTIFYPNWSLVFLTLPRGKCQWAGPSYVFSSAFFLKICSGLGSKTILIWNPQHNGKEILKQGLGLYQILPLRSLGHILDNTCSYPWCGIGRSASGIAASGTGSGHPGKWQIEKLLGTQRSMVRIPSLSNDLE